MLHTIRQWMLRHGFATYRQKCKICKKIVMPDNDSLVQHILDEHPDVFLKVIGIALTNDDPNEMVRQVKVLIGEDDGCDQPQDNQDNH